MYYITHTLQLFFVPDESRVEVFRSGHAGDHAQNIFAQAGGVSILRTGPETGSYRCILRIGPEVTDSWSRISAFCTCLYN